MALLSLLTSMLLGYVSYGSADNLRVVGRPVCEVGSCHPRTGNLLIGRAKNLTATSTCGLNGPVGYCIVSHLETKGKKCFTCDSRPGASLNTSHRIENVIYRTAPGSDLVTWWQSENGKENVSIQLDLEAEFHFTHLIMKFRTFKPKAMLVERSSDFGKTWKEYRYFAENCEEAFPHVKLTRQRTLSDVVCDSIYNKVNPSDGGEVILRVISPSLQKKKSPYTDEVQELLKITNLRINFTKLYTLGDDKLDRRPEIQEKYYYAITEMTVRGSCWCYGHAEKCLPQSDDIQQVPDMVYGKCDCSHNTTGLNCDKCKPTHNDLEWKAATGRLTNACKRCNCNEHAETCDFNKEVFIKSGQVSGSVCHNCQHNTMGNNCEKCIPGYFHNPSLPITDPYTCLSCSCNLAGTIDDGLCESSSYESNFEAGQCHCKKNVMGLKCDQCKPGFWNLNKENPDGCEACNCSLAGSRSDTTCDALSGRCLCKDNVTGQNCDQCVLEHWGLSADTEGCQPCNCDIGGSLDTNCDVINGQCKCLPNLIGKTCSKPEQSFYVPNLDLVFEAENAKCVPNCQHTERKYEPQQYYTGTGHMKVFDNSELEFYINNVPASGEYDVILRYENPEDDWDEVTLELLYDHVDPNGPCANTIPSDYIKKLQPRSRSRYVVANSSLCLEKNRPYRLKLTFKSDSNQVDASAASILIDSIALVPRSDAIPFFHGSPINDMRRKEYEYYRCNEAYYTPLRDHIHDICKRYHFSISVNIHGGAQECQCDKTGSNSAFCKEDGGACDCKLNVVGRMCDKCASGTYGFYSPQGCKDCDCNWDGAIDNHCDVVTGQCTCKERITGRECNHCHPGQWNFPNCQPCQCHGHAHVCNEQTGECINCQNFTTGHYCDQCADGYYGEPKETYYGGLPCRPCHCPDTIDSGHSFAKTCTLNSITKDVHCICDEGYTGPHCDKCADNYYGNPEEPGGSCQPCKCNNNIDLSRSGNCDSRTGQCIQCLYNTTGPHCEICQDNFYGDALKQHCTECMCDILGTDSKAGPCNKETGQCPCLPNVEGRICDTCKQDHWAIARGIGCIPCECDPVGSVESHCDVYLGVCKCTEGFGGDKCNQCQDKFWGDPNVKCYPCMCDAEGSRNGTCDPESGVCHCNEGIGGEKCDICARGFNGDAPFCNRCGECFENWDEIIDSLANKTTQAIEEAGNVKRKGTPGAYNTAFEDMTIRLEDVTNILTNTKQNKHELDLLSNRINDFKNTALYDSTEKVNKLSNVVQNVLANISISSYSLTTVRDKAEDLQLRAQELSDNATNLQEKDLKGALNLTREAGENSKKVHLIEKNTSALLIEADRQCRRVENFLNKDSDSFSRTEMQNEKVRLNLEFEISQLEKKIPDLNGKICDKKGDPCHPLCGGAGCGRCGGFSCDKGAVGKADAGINLITDIKEKIDNQLRKAEMLYRQISNSKVATESGRESTRIAYDAAEDIKNQFERIILKLSEVNKKFDSFIKNSGATPAEIRHVANDALNLNIQLKPQQIKELADQINETVASLTNINAILEDTKQNQSIASDLKSKSDEAKVQAEKILEKAQKVVEALKAAKDAQEEAEKAINTAHKDITATKKDLKQIESETDKAKSKAFNTTDLLKNANMKLKQLQSVVLNHANGAKQVSSEAEKVSKKVQESKDKVLDLNVKYDTVLDTVQKRSENSSSLKLRAQKLLQKAQQLSVNTTAKFKELKDANSMYNEQDEQLKAISLRIQELTTNVDQYTKNISALATHYKVCS